jgi:hypothetical protein
MGLNGNNGKSMLGLSPPPPVGGSPGHWPPGGITMGTNGNKGKSWLGCSPPSGGGSVGAINGIINALNGSIQIFVLNVYKNQSSFFSASSICLSIFFSRFFFLFHIIKKTNNVTRALTTSIKM